ncbi:MAG: hypothetical protein ACK5EA_08945, partial [Planctomycetaceae bacterium]
MITDAGDSDRPFPRPEVIALEVHSTSHSSGPAQRAGTRALTHVVRRPNGPTIHPVPAKFIHVQSEPD